MIRNHNRSIQNIVLVLLAVVFVPVGLKLGAPYLGPIFLSIFLAIILTPILKWFTARGWSYRSALIFTVIVSVAIGLILIAFIVLTLAGFKDQISSYQSSFAQTSEPLRSLFQLLSSNVQITQVASVFFDGVFILFGTLFLLIEIPRFHESMVTRLGTEHTIVRGTEELYHDILDYFVVRIKVNFYTSIGVTVALLVMGIHYALLWGFLAFALSFVPYIGYPIAALPPILIAWTQYGLPGVVAVIVIYGVVNIIAEYLIFPQLASKAFAIPIYVVFVSVFFWGWILGLAGVLLAVPLTMAVIIFFGQFEETAWLVPILRGGRSKNRTRSLFKSRAK